MAPHFLIAQVELKNAQTLLTQLVGKANRNTGLKSVIKESAQGVYQSLSEQGKSDALVKRNMRKLGLSEKELQSVGSQFSGELKEKFEQVKSAAPDQQQEEGWGFLQQMFDDQNASGAKAVQAVGAEVVNGDDTQILIQKRS
jgi:hypothetical protein